MHGCHTTHGDRAWSSPEWCGGGGRDWPAGPSIAWGGAISMGQGPKRLFGAARAGEHSCCSQHMIGKARGWARFYDFVSSPGVGVAVPETDISMASLSRSSRVGHGSWGLFYITAKHLRAFLFFVLVLLSRFLPSPGERGAISIKWARSENRGATFEFLGICGIRTQYTER